MKKIDYSLYLCTDRALMSTNSVEECVRLAIDGGTTVVQLREKECSALCFYKTALAVKAITQKAHVPLIINDRVDIAIACNAQGVHVGQSDLPAKAVRKMIGEDKILGVSATNLEQALQAEQDGADYIGVGAVFQTGTKTDAQYVSLDTLKEIKGKVDIPVVAIGGIQKENIEKLVGTGIDGIAVVSAIVAQENIKTAAAKLLELYKKL